MNVEVDFIKEALDAGLYKHTTRITSSILLQTSDIEAPVPCHLGQVHKVLGYRKEMVKQMLVYKGVRVFKSSKLRKIWLEIR